MVERYKPPEDGEDATEGEVVPFPGVTLEQGKKSKSKALVTTKPKRGRPRGSNKNKDKTDGRGKALATKSERIQLAEACKDYTGRAFEILKELLEGETTSETVKLRCIEMLFDRGYGRVAQAEKEQHTAGGMLVTPEQLQRLSYDERHSLESLVTKLLGMGGPATEDPGGVSYNERLRIAEEFEKALD